MGKFTGAGKQGVQHQQTAVGVTPQRLLLQVERCLGRHRRAQAIAQQVKELVRATTGQPGQRVGLLRNAGPVRGVVVSAGRTLDAQRCAVTDGDQQRCLAAGEVSQQIGIQCTDGGIAIEHPDHRVAAFRRRAVGPSDPQLIVPLAVGRVDQQAAEAVVQVGALQQAGVHRLVRRWPGLGRLPRQGQGKQQGQGQGEVSHQVISLCFKTTRSGWCRACAPARCTSPHRPRRYWPHPGRCLRGTGACRTGCRYPWSGSGWR